MSQSHYCYNCQRQFVDYMDFNTCNMCLYNFCRDCYMKQEHWNTWRCHQCHLRFCPSEYNKDTQQCNYCYYHNVDIDSLS